MSNLNKVLEWGQNLTGMKFGRMLVIEKLPGNNRYLCRCDCGSEKSVRGPALRSGNTKSCGCLHKEQAFLNGKANTRHGMAVHGKRKKVWLVWQSMRRRCFDKNNRCWRYYGAKGVSVCERWMVFENFLEDMGEPPSGKHSIDRIDPSGNYEPGNCRWATSKQQAFNKRNTVFLVFNGEKKTIPEWSEITGIPVSTIKKRIQYGWSVERNLTTKRRKLNVKS